MEIIINIKGVWHNKKSSSDLVQIFGRGGFWGLELESGDRFSKLSSEGGEFGPPTEKMPFFQIAWISMKLGPRVVFKA